MGDEFAGGFEVVFGCSEVESCLASVVFVRICQYGILRCFLSPFLKTEESLKDKRAECPLGKLTLNVYVRFLAEQHINQLIPFFQARSNH